MASIDWNKKIWENKEKWCRDGDNWSDAWGGTTYLWHGTIFPRIQNFLPTNTILEIAPGFGRITQYLKNLSKKLIVVDLSNTCIDKCKERFASNSNIEYFQNDGKSLSFVPDNSIDFIFSWDSLVHVDKEVIKSYIKEASRILKKDGFGFIHHSNAGIYSEEAMPYVNTGSRDPTVTAKFFEKICKEEGLQCIAQEIFSWGTQYLTDCISVFTSKKDSAERPNHVVVNNKLRSQEAENLKNISQLYSP